MRTNEKIIKEISVGNVNIPISAKYIGDYEIGDIQDMIDDSKYTLPTATDTTLGGVNKGYTIPYIVGSSSDTAGVWTGSCNGITSYKDGLTIIYVPQKAGSNNGTTLNINNLGAKVCHITNTSNLTTHFSAGTPILLTYVTVSGTGYWKRGDYDSWTPYTSAYCTTGGSTAAKSASLSNYVLTSKTYVFISISNANTVRGAITLNINGKGAKPIYINGSASSASNYTLPAGTYIVYYDGTNYHFRTDGKLPGEILTNLSNQNVMFSVSDFSFYDDGTDETTVNLQIKSGYDKRIGLYFDTVNLATGETGETFTAGGGISITAATSSKAGVMSAADKTKLNGIATGATANTGTVTSITIGKGLTGGSNGSITTSGTIKCNLNSETSLGTIGSTSKLYAVGVDANNKLCVNVPWSDTNTTYSVATASANGLMSAADKVKLNNLKNNYETITFNDPDYCNNAGVIVDKMPLDDIFQMLADYCYNCPTDTYNNGENSFKLIIRPKTSAGAEVGPYYAIFDVFNIYETSPHYPDATDLQVIEFSGFVNTAAVNSSNLNGGYCGILKYDGSEFIERHIYNLGLPNATSQTLGGVKIGSNITVSTSGTISLTKSNVTSALGYTPPTTNTATTSTNGLMSAADKDKLNYLSNYLRTITCPLDFDEYASGNDLDTDAVCHWWDSLMGELASFGMHNNVGCYKVILKGSASSKWSSYNTSIMTLDVTVHNDDTMSILGLINESRVPGEQGLNTYINNATAGSWQQGGPIYGLVDAGNSVVDIKQMGSNWAFNYELQWNY